MQSAQRGQVLDFGQVQRGRYSVYVRQQSTAKSSILHKLRRKLNDAAPAEQAIRTLYTPPRYDSSVIAALESVEED